MKKLFLAAVALCLSAPAFAEQTLYSQVGPWFIYKEAKSCAMYADYPEGSMLRFSDRRDEGRLYFNVINENWEDVPVGADVMIHLSFPEAKRGQGSPGQAVENPDGRLGYGAGHFARDEVLDLLASKTQMIVEIGMDRENGKFSSEPLGRYEIVRGDAGVRELRACSKTYFEGR